MPLLTGSGHSSSATTLQRAGVNKSSSSVSLTAHASVSSTPRVLSSASLKGLASRAPGTSRLQSTTAAAAAPRPLSHASPPTSAAELLHPLTRPDLPEWAQKYISLLAESSSSQGSMQRHLVRLLAHGAADASKVAQFLGDPLDPVKGAVARGSSDLILRRLNKTICEASVASRSHDEQDDAAAAAAMAAAAAAAAAGDPSTPPRSGRAAAGRAALASPTGSASYDPWNAWAAASAASPPRTTSADDLTCAHASAMHPLHGRVLSLMLSLLMSGATSSAWSALEPLAPAGIPFIHPQHTTSTVLSATPTPVTSPPPLAVQLAATALQSAPSLTSAPSLQSTGSVGAATQQLLNRASSTFARAGSAALQSQPSGWVEGVLGGGSMAASTAMKLLRADSKHIVVPDLLNVLDGLLDVVSESMDEGFEREAATAATAGAIERQLVTAASSKKASEGQEGGEEEEVEEGGKEEEEEEEEQGNEVLEETEETEEEQEQVEVEVP